MIRENPKLKNFENRIETKFLKSEDGKREFIVSRDI